MKVTQVDVMGPFEQAKITYSVSAAHTSENPTFERLNEALERFEVEVEVAERRAFESPAFAKSLDRFVAYIVGRPRRATVFAGLLLSAAILVSLRRPRA